ncbi:DUF397 domain-containing protein [Spirillospora sp. NPDC050365]
MTPWRKASRSGTSGQSNCVEIAAPSLDSAGRRIRPCLQKATPGRYP